MTGPGLQNDTILKPTENGAGRSWACSGFPKQELANKVVAPTMAFPNAPISCCLRSYLAFGKSRSARNQPAVDLTGSQ